MEDTQETTPDYRGTIRDWKAQIPWWKRFSAHLGVQGKLVLCFILLVAAATAASCWIFLSRSTVQLADMMGEQARQISSTLALTSEHSLRSNNYPELKRIGQDLIKSRNILFISFLNAEGNPIVMCSRDLELKPSQLALSSDKIHSLMQIHPMHSATFGDYIEVIAPIITSSSLSEQVGKPATQSKLLGYAAIGMSQAGQEAQLQWINYLVLGVGCLTSIIAMPLSYLLVRRMFQPIRELERATRKIIAGELDTRVATYRPDLIGDLARAFNEMLQWVKKQRQDIIAANEKLAEANRELEARIEQRTSQLESANLRLGQEIAEKEDFIRAVSHDLNAPLRNIAGMATMLLTKHREKFEEDVIHRLERIKKNVDVESELINELLELSRIKTRRQKLEPVDLESLVWDLRGLFENDLKTKGIDLMVDSALPTISVEKARIRQVFQNLVDNSIKYMGDQMERQIHIGCIVRLTEVEFYVRDTGIGIDPDDLDKVFFVFRRGRSRTVQNISGKGVGLASVKSIIEMYSGRIWVESELGKGCTFRFTINGKHVPSISQNIRPSGRLAIDTEGPEGIAA